MKMGINQLSPKDEATLQKMMQKYGSASIISIIGEPSSKDYYNQYVIDLKKFLDLYAYDGYTYGDYRINLRGASYYLEKWQRRAHDGDEGDWYDYDYYEEEYFNFQTGVFSADQEKIRLTGEAYQKKAAQILEKIEEAIKEGEKERNEFIFKNRG